ncbi:MAG: hypothetical protein WBG43_12630 [Marinifilaceae bacterium]
MSLTIHTDKIYEHLIKGQFICSNSPNIAIRKLYSIIDEDDNYTELYEYFKKINLILERGNQYYYFSRKETKVNLERKLEYLFKWIDIIDFFKTYDSSFDSGYRFIPSDILVSLKTDAELKSKLDAIKKHTNGRENYSDIIKRTLDSLVRDNFLEIEDELSNTYKVLSSFKYLEELILLINIPEEVENEIPE